MKITVKKAVTGFEIIVLDATGSSTHHWVFETMGEVEAFMRGMQTAKDLANSLVQSIPTSVPIRGLMRMV